MSKILLIEPHKMLQRAIALSFFPDHEVELSDAFPEASTLQKGYDVVVIDAGALREKNGAGEELSPVQNWAVPTIWLEERSSATAPAREKLVVVRKPLAKNDLLSALADLTLAPAPATVPLAAEKNDAARVEKDPINAAPAPGPHAQQPRVIELVDVVEEAPADKEERPKARTKK